MKICLTACLIGLFLLSSIAAAETQSLIWVERKTDGDRELLIKNNIPLIREFSSGFLAEGDQGSVQSALDKLGFSSQALDKDSGNSSYALAGFRSGKSDPIAVSDCGQILWSEENWLLLKIDASLPRHCSESTGWFWQPLSRKPLKPAKHPDQYGKKATTFTVKPLVQEMVGSLTDAIIQSHWNDVVTGQTTRYSSSSGCQTAAQNIFNKFDSYHLNPVFQSHTSGWAPNVIGVRPGVIHPDKVYIVIGHLDDEPSSGNAPGADDNASGSSIVPALGQIMSCYAFTNTVKFITVTGEEQGLVGSNYYADHAHAEGEDIQAVLNGDMIAWEGDGIPDPENLDLDFDEQSQWLGEFFAQSAQDYGTGLAVDAFLCPSLCASDHCPFWQNGYSAVCGITDNEGYCGHGGHYPYYHTSEDTQAHCGDLTFFYNAARTYLAALGHLADPFKIRFVNDTVSCNGTTPVLVGDADLNTDPNVQETATIQVWSTAEPAPETVVLTEEGTDSMLFSGTVTTTSDPPVHGDGKISVTASDTVNAEYVDALACTGASNVPYDSTIAIDCVPPQISNVQTTDIQGQSATITWDTNEDADSTVVYDTAIPPSGQTVTDPAKATTHSVHVTGLNPCSTYHYYVQSTDVVGNTASDTNSGSYYTFMTGPLTNPAYESTDVPKSIPDNGTVLSVINIPEDKTILDVNVQLNITHPYDSDLDIYLVSPNGTHIELTTDNGGSGANYTDTIFDDEAATLITAGAPPFTGSYRPEAPLSVLDGTSTFGTWTLEVTDDAVLRTGTLNSWSLTFTIPAEICVPGLEYQSKTIVDSCSGYGSPGDGVIDPGEEIVMPVIAHNNAVTGITGITATLSTTTPGITITGATANFPDIPSNGTGESMAPHFAYTVGDTVACNSPINFTINFTANEGNYSDTFTVAAGSPTCYPCLASCPAVAPSTSVPNAIIDVAYSHAMTAAGGVPPYTYAVTAGSLPTGLSLASNGMISGTATVLETASFDITASDRNGCSGAQGYSLTVGCPAIAFTPDNLPSGAAGVAYDQSVTAAGGSSPYIYAVTSGSLPAGLSMDPAGHITGTPTAAGAFSFVVTATDENTCTGTKSYTLIINCSAFAITPSALASGQVGVAYDQTVTAVGGKAPYIYAVSSGSLPAGLTMDSTGHITGSPSLRGTFNFNIRATDANNCIATKPYSISISCSTFAFLPANLPDGATGTAYDQTITVTGGAAPYTFAVTSGGLPAGLSMDTSGNITGTPSTEGISSFQVTATDTAGCSGTHSYSINVVTTCLFCDDFGDGVTDDWLFLKGTWTENGGTLSASPVRKAIAVTNPAAFSGCLNCYVEASLQTAGGIGNRLWMLGWYADKDNTIELLMKQENGRWILRQRSGGRIVAKAAYNAAIEPDTFYTARITFDGAQLHLAIDGAEVASLTPAAPVASGRVGFQVKATTGAFDYITVNP